MSKDFHRVLGPVLFGSVCSLIAFAAQFFNEPTIQNVTTALRNNIILITAFALGLGVVNLMIVNYRYIKSKRPGLWMFAPIFLVLFPILVVLGYIKNPYYTLMVNDVNIPVTTAIDSFVSFFIIQGMYRSLRVKNVEGVIITVTTILVMLRKVPIGALIWSGIIPVGDWLLMTASVGGTRALIIVFAFGVVSLSIRAILGYERSHLGLIEGFAEA